MIPIRVVCEICYAQWEIEDGDIDFEPYPKFVCPRCGNWIAMF